MGYVPRAFQRDSGSGREQCGGGGAIQAQHPVHYGKRLGFCREREEGGKKKTRLLPTLSQVDDLGWNAVAFHGNNPLAHTPNMNRLAKEGISLERYYAYKYCSPSRASFLTGRIPGHDIYEVNPSRLSDEVYGLVLFFFFFWEEGDCFVEESPV